MSAEALKQNELKILWGHTLQLQRMVRGMLGRRKHRATHQKRTKAAILIQSVYRRHCSTHRVAYLVLSLRMACVTIQRVWRGCIARECVRWRCRWRTVACSDIQRLWRGHAARKFTAMFESRCSNAARVIQKAWACYKSLATWILWIGRVSSIRATKVQALARGRHARRQYRDLYEPSMRAVQMVQRARRRLLQRRAAIAKRGWRKAWKVFLAVKFLCRLKWSHARSEYIVTKLQRRLKAWRNLELVRQYVLSRGKNTRTLQRLARGMAGRQQARYRWGCIVTTQAAVRAFLANTRTRKLQESYARVATEICQEQHEAIRMLSVFPMRTFCNKATERFMLGTVLRNYKTMLRRVYFLASLMGSLQLDKFFRVTQLQMRSVLKEAGALDGKGQDCVEVSRADLDVILAAAMTPKPFIRFDSGAEIGLENSEVKKQEVSEFFDLDCFLEVVVETARLRYPKLATYSGRLHRLCEEVLEPFSMSFVGSGSECVSHWKLSGHVNEDDKVGASITKALVSKEVIALTKKPALGKVFKAVAGRTNTVDARGYFTMMKNLRMMDSNLSWSNLITTFVNCVPNVTELLETMYKLEDLETLLILNKAQFMAALIRAGLLKHMHTPKLKTTCHKVEKFLDDVLAKSRS